jgi:hypothetical protein
MRTGWVSGSARRRCLREREGSGAEEIHTLVASGGMLCIHFRNRRAETFSRKPCAVSRRKPTGGPRLPEVASRAHRSLWTPSAMRSSYRSRMTSLVRIGTSLKAVPGRIIER